MSLNEIREVLAELAAEAKDYPLSRVRARFIGAICERGVNNLVPKKYKLVLQDGDVERRFWLQTYAVPCPVRRLRGEFWPPLHEELRAAAQSISPPLVQVSVGHKVGTTSWAVLHLIFLNQEVDQVIDYVTRAFWSEPREPRKRPQVVWSQGATEARAGFEATLASNPIEALQVSTLFLTPLALVARTVSRAMDELAPAIEVTTDDGVYVGLQTGGHRFIIRPRDVEVWLEEHPDHAQESSVRRLFLGTAATRNTAATTLAENVYRKLERRRTLRNLFAQSVPVGPEAVYQQAYDLWLKTYEKGDVPEASTGEGALARWANDAFPVVTMAQNLPAALMVTDPPEGEVRSPWDVFLIEVPADILQAEALHILVQMCDGVWHIRTVGTNGALQCLVVGKTTESLLRSAFHTLHDEAEASTADLQRALISRLVLNACQALTNANPSRRQATSSEPGVRRPQKDTPRRSYEVGPAINVDFLPVVREYLERAGPVGQRRPGVHIQLLVRGHWKHQPCGPKQTLRRLMWIAPYWKGPLAAVTRIRPYVLVHRGAVPEAS